MKTRSIRVLDLVDGKHTERPSHTPTIDLPPDLDRSVGTVSLDGHSHGRYRANGGKELTCSAFVRPLSWRAAGELFLLGDGKKDANTYRLSSIEAERPRVTGRTEKR